ncbi:MAG: hypothetical protein J0H69_11140 [Burkholderiales bacterium]|nr:hypothetical protein [Burkholderiales bacterium]
MTAPESPQRLRLPINGLTLLSLVASFFGACAVLLHFVGDIAHRQYLGFWGIDRGVFQKSADWLLINGYYSVFGQFVALLGTAWKNWYWVLTAVLLLGLYFFLLSAPTRRIQEEDWYTKLPAHWRRLINCILLSAWLGTVLLATVLLSTLAMGAVGAIGELAGRTTAERRQAEFAKGCQAASSFCIDVVKDDQIRFTGFLLDSSSTHIAVLDAATRRGRVIERAGFEIAAHAKRLEAP